MLPGAGLHAVPAGLVAADDLPAGAMVAIDTRRRPDRRHRHTLVLQMLLLLLPPPPLPLLLLLLLLPALAGLVATDDSLHARDSFGIRFGGRVVPGAFFERWRLLLLLLGVVFARVEACGHAQT